LEAGKLADLIMVDRARLQEITTLQQVSWVMKGGRIVSFKREYDGMTGKTPWLRGSGEENIDKRLGSDYKRP
jgi:hypothetical protein